MNNLKTVGTLLVLLIFFSCSNKQELKQEVKQVKKQVKQEVKQEDIIYSADLKSDCEKIRPSAVCIIVKETKVYKDVKGFTYEKGFDYVLKIKRTKIKNQTNEFSFKYELLKIVSKKEHNCKKEIKHLEKKPILYLYPEDDINVTVKIKNYKKITYSYPKYPKDGWNVEVQKGGKINFNDKDYYSLYWELEDYGDFKFDEGFIVKKENIISFLEKSLKTLGLNYRESQEFIIYWLPILSKNELTLIKFETSNYNKQQPIEILPKPDTLIRIMMIYKKIDAIDILIKEQVLHKNKREGFVAVEWGGAEIK